jgi:uncharacterized membrane protein
LGILVLLNNFLHDLSAAGWLVGTVLLWSILRKRRQGSHPGTGMIGVVKTLSLMVKLSLAGVVLFGVIRAFAYGSYEWNAAAGQSQVTLLVVKHVIFTGIVVLGLVYYMRARKLLIKGRDEKAE